MQQYLNKLLLALVQGPGGGEPAGILARVAVAQHHLLVVPVQLPVCDTHDDSLSLSIVDGDTGAPHAHTLFPM